MSQIIILNGPIGCGKDTVGVAFAEREGWEFTAFKDPMFRIAATTLGMDFHEFIESYQDREWKDSPNEKLNGRTVRELMIHISETYIKPFLGSDYFGQQAADYIRRRPWQRHFIFGDGGFSPEVEALITAGHDVILVHMYRDGCTFEGDSRSYVLTNSVPRIYTLTNNGTVDEAIEALGRILDEHEDSRIINEPTELPDEPPVVARRATPRRTGRQSIQDSINRAARNIAEQQQRRVSPSTGQWSSQGTAWQSVYSAGTVSGNAGTESVESSEVADVPDYASLEQQVTASFVDEFPTLYSGLAG